MYPKVLCGIEFGYSKAASLQYKKLADEYPFDYIINSVHTLPGRGDSYYPAFFDGKTIRQSYLDYFNAVLASVKADFDYQIIGHIGYVSRYCKGENSKIRYCDYSEIFDEILKEIINRDKCLEINTSSANAGSDFLPDCDVVEQYLKLGGKKLSFASDAHKACDYLRKESIVKKYLKSIGIDKLCYYENRKCVYYDI
jgi:histidinol-phosphatase (PHP family)